LLKKYTLQAKSLGLENADSRTAAKLIADVGIPSGLVRMVLLNGRSLKSRGYVFREAMS